MLETVDEDEKILLSTRNNSATARGSASKKWFLTENGLYEVLFQSRKPIAHHFKSAVKKILRDMRHDRGETMPEFFEHLDHQADLEALNDLREDMNLPSLTMEEYLRSED